MSVRDGSVLLLAGRHALPESILVGPSSWKTQSPVGLTRGRVEFREACNLLVLTFFGGGVVR